MLVVRVHQDLLAAERVPAAAKKHDVWAGRYREINDWERYLVDNGIHVVKVMLNLSRREQAKRFLKRIDRLSAGQSPAMVTCAGCSTVNLWRTVAVCPPSSESSQVSSPRSSCSAGFGLVSRSRTLISPSVDTGMWS